MKANSYLMSDSEFATAVELIVGGFEKKYVASSPFRIKQKEMGWRFWLSHIFIR